jgi:hypothetical protein
MVVIPISPWPTLISRRVRRTPTHGNSHDDERRRDGWREMAKQQHRRGQGPHLPLLPHPVSRRERPLVPSPLWSPVWAIELVV